MITWNILIIHTYVPINAYNNIRQIYIHMYIVSRRGLHLTFWNSKINSPNDVNENTKNIKKKLAKWCHYFLYNMRKMCVCFLLRLLDIFTFNLLPFAFYARKIIKWRILSLIWQMFNKTTRLKSNNNWWKKKQEIQNNNKNKK